MPKPQSHDRSKSACAELSLLYCMSSAVHVVRGGELILDEHCRIWHSGSCSFGGLLRKKRRNGDSPMVKYEVRSSSFLRSKFSDVLLKVTSPALDWERILIHGIGELHSV